MVRSKAAPRKLIAGPAPRPQLPYKGARKTPATTCKPVRKLSYSAVEVPDDSVTCVVSCSVSGKSHGDETLLATMDGTLLRLLGTADDEHGDDFAVDEEHPLELYGTGGGPYGVPKGGFLTATWDAYSGSVLLLEGGEAGPDGHMRLSFSSSSSKLRDYKDAKGASKREVGTWGWEADSGSQSYDERRGCGHRFDSDEGEYSDALSEDLRSFDSEWNYEWSKSSIGKRGNGAAA
ncbi:hypothetical protein GPECTOR_15g333 [Gonium pectorale]|uniref:Uncharacterized protein n=1 Tax=Gonium pectorale TaxID=33097 RepID=A0A150GLB9_GONPE|nr:hypothetical protein GPECTOR_15g333 [Gonium pectorale]|eukprot:KXZ50649.1 hypothetical protein GPECTOR_15g333 [Gonium pectorale]